MWMLRCEVLSCWGLLTATAACALAASGAAVVLVLVEREGITNNRAINEVKNLFWIDVDAHEAGLEVKVWASAAASVSAQCDRCAGFHKLVGFNQEFRKVAIYSLKTIVVTHYYKEAISVTLKLGESHFS